MRIMQFIAGAAVGAGLALATLPAGANEGKPVRWKMQSWFPSKAPHAGTTGKDIETKLLRLSGGSFRVQFSEPGALIPPNQCLEAVGKGSVQACWSTPVYWYATNQPSRFIPQPPSVWIGPA